MSLGTPSEVWSTTTLQYTRCHEAGAKASLRRQLMVVGWVSIRAQATRRGSTLSLIPIPGARLVAISKLRLAQSHQWEMRTRLHRGLPRSWSLTFKLGLTLQKQTSAGWFLVRKAPLARRADFPAGRERLPQSSMSPLWSRHCRMLLCRLKIRRFLRPGELPPLPRHSQLPQIRR